MWRSYRCLLKKKIYISINRNVSIPNIMGGLLGARTSSVRVYSSRSLITVTRLFVVPSFFLHLKPLIGDPISFRGEKKVLIMCAVVLVTL